ncbi:MAG: hypothetical protein OXU75_02230 [Deltaproteobacteria bacterium]|nr:hypothetical protein [Deltaproteobacteria bacterium]
MSNHRRDLLGALLQIVHGNYGEPPVADTTLKEFFELTRRACNLVSDVLTAEEAQRRRDEVMSAKDIFIQAHQARPDRWDGVNHLARVSFLLGELDEAESWNQEAFHRIRTDGGEEYDHPLRNARYAQYHELQGEIALAKADFRTAKQEFLHALAIEQSVHNRFSLVRVYSMTGEIDSAVAQIQELESHQDFVLWVGEFLARVLKEADFAFLRASLEWRGTKNSRGIRSRWADSTKEASEGVRRRVTTDKMRKRGLKRALRGVAVIAIVLGVKLLFPNVSLGGDESGNWVSSVKALTVPSRTAAKELADLRPWGVGGHKPKALLRDGGALWGRIGPGTRGFPREFTRLLASSLVVRRGGVYNPAPTVTHLVHQNDRVDPIPVLFLGTAPNRPASCNDQCRLALPFTRMAWLVTKALRSDKR